ncbi:hypothetical protein WLF10_04803 [Enterobacter cloacae]
MLTRCQPRERRELPRLTEPVLQPHIRQQHGGRLFTYTRYAVQQFSPVLHIRVIIRQVLYLFLQSLQLRFQPQKVRIDARHLHFPCRLPAVQLLRVHVRQGLMPQYQRP